MRYQFVCVSLALIVTLMVVQNIQLVESKSFLNYIPGGDYLREMSNEIVDLVQGSFDHTMEKIIGQGASPNQLDETNQGSAIDLHSFPNDPDTNRSVSEIIRSRGFEAEEHDVVTGDGYILTVQRIVNPLVDPKYRPKMKPVILQHGLMSSSVDWVINSLSVKPMAYPKQQLTTSDQSNSNNMLQESNNIEENSTNTNRRDYTKEALGFYLANMGYDVYLANSRGNKYGQRHVKYSSWDPRFWAFTFDEQIKYDLPDTITYVQKLTNHTKVAYVGHSQGTSMALGLLSERPEYADIMEPVVLLAPVAYANNCLSPVKYFAFYAPVFAHINMWFANSNAAVKYLAPIVCGPNWVRDAICTNLIFLSTGFDREEIDMTRAKAYFSHMPSGTSVKNIAHWGQAVLSGKFQKFDHGILGNQMAYGKPNPPQYDLTKIRSKSLVMFIAENDWLASPKDVARLRAELTVQPLKVYNVTESVPGWNHIDFVYAKDASWIINEPIIQVFEQYRNEA